MVRRYEEERGETLMENIENDVLEFKAVITYAKYYSPDTTWGCYTFYTDADIPYYTSSDALSTKGQKFGTLAGKMQELTVGGEYLVKAIYKRDKKYGHQYVPNAVYAIIPQSPDMQKMFLESIIAPTTAENLIKAYPNLVEDVINGELDIIDYTKVKGVREATWNKVKEKIINNYLISDILTMLTPLGVTYKMIRKLLDDIPNPTLLKQQLEQNPYILVRIRGLGFKRIDELALKLKPALLDSHERLVAFVKYFFVELGEEGHTWCSKSILYDAISNNAAECLDKFNWLLSNEDFLHIHGDKIGLKSYHDIELQIFHLLSQKNEQVTGINISEEQIQQAIQFAEEQQGFQYVQEQLEVIHDSLNRPLSIITGKAGTGKSTIMRAILCAYTQNKYTVTASALSAMAAQRITEATEFPAMTIHRTLGCQGINKFTFNKDNKLLTNVAFLDEGSMVNASLFLAWLEAIDDNTRIIICGDHKQLPPIGYGNVFSDIIDKLDKACVSQLTKPMRQAEQSGILVDANIIRENKNPIQKPKNRIIHGDLQDMYYMFRTNRQSLFDIAVKTFLDSVETDGLKNVVLAVPRKQGCLNSTFELNQVLQDKLLKDEMQTISNARIDFKLGAKVMQTVNDYDKNVFNGEIGYITCIDSYMDKGKRKEYCEITYTDAVGQSKVIHYEQNELSSIDLAYAMTVHKMQGSGVKTLIGIIDNTHYQLLDSCMLYTMLTRAKKRCLLLAEPSAFLQCIRTSHNERNTWLQLEC